MLGKARQGKEDLQGRAGQGRTGILTRAMVSVSLHDPSINIPAKLRRVASAEKSSPDTETCVK